MRCRHLLPVLLCFLLMLPVSADFMEENDIIGQTIVIEEDENRVKKNIDADKKPETAPEGETLPAETERTLSVTRSTYTGKFIFPFLAVLAAGICLCAGTALWEHLRTGMPDRKSSPAGRKRT